ncbi:cysteine hydrolase [Vibrio sp. SS-MA-C1-2]|uniref:isochorismatase family cysteine hydrolase n=1 Tax=Vibrio sp. SS-MA-C1-2 TaxID=2908646 RepID=UPI001F196F56|nr:isochorismatase family cysteine hydrolase [Vibrio sp. SS-MA-C1-2]UJF17306.1 cysteine hydrolase [Vibrio sp. SS-MA-C1-2]
MKTALIVIDFINDIVHSNGKIPSCAEQVRENNVIEKANQAISWAKEKNVLTIFVKVGFDSNYHSQPKSSPIFGQADQYKALELNHWGTEFHQDLDFSDNDLIVIKPRINPFYNTQLDAILRVNKIDALLISGVSTTWAIQSIVRDGHDRDYQLTVIQDACAASTQIEHQASLEMISRLADCINVDTLIK